MTEKRQGFLLQRQVEWLKYQPDAKQLIDLIEGNYEGSIIVAPPGNMESDLPKLLNKHEVFDQNEWDIEYMKMEAGLCHHNSSEIWSKLYYQLEAEGKLDELHTFICTGYYLVKDDDGMLIWRQHTWLVDQETHVIRDPSDTSAIRYLGYVMNMEECNEFVECNI